MPFPRVTSLTLALSLAVISGATLYVFGQPSVVSGGQGSALAGEFVALSKPEPWPDVVLEDTERLSFDSQRLLGKPWWVFFGYSRCSTVCPVVLGKIALARQSMRQRNEEPPSVLFVSLDSSDSHQDVAMFVSIFGHDLLGAIGEEECIRELTTAVGTHFRVDPSAPGELLHSGAVFVLNERAQIVGRFNPPHDPVVLAGGGGQ